MTRIQVLRDARAEWVEKSIAAKETISEIYVREQNAIKDALLPFFEDFSEGVVVEVTRGSVYFKMFDPGRGYNKEIFSLYLKEDWSGDRSFKGVDLSYYSTSTKGEDTWELKRLQLLGKLAEVVLKDQDIIVINVNAAVLSFKEEYEVAYELQNLINTAISDIDVRIKQLTKERVEFDLKNEGVEFTKKVCIDFKYNYSANIQALKLSNISKSGKTADVVFNYNEGDKFRFTENNCNVEKIIEQVAHYFPNFVKDTKEELLPS
jgi:hypothetical protein